jgi:hypothetical protein
MFLGLKALKLSTVNQRDGEEPVISNGNRLGSLRLPVSSGRAV